MPRLSPVPKHFIHVKSLPSKNSSTSNSFRCNFKTRLPQRHRCTGVASARHRTRSALKYSRYAARLRSSIGRGWSIIKSGWKTNLRRVERYYWCSWRRCMQIKTRDRESGWYRARLANTSTHATRAHRHVRHLGNCVAWLGHVAEARHVR